MTMLYLGLFICIETVIKWRKSMRFYCEEKEEVLKVLNSCESGLDSVQAEKRLEENGKNKLEAAKGKSIIQRF